MYNKIYINADDLEKEDEIEKFHFLFDEKDPYIIWSHAMKMGESYDGKIYDVAVLEIFLFYNYLLNKGYKKENIEILSNKALFIKNDDLYKIEKGEVIKMCTDNVGFFTVRAINWNNPFFFLINKIIKKKGGVVKRTNPKNSTIHGKAKFYALNSLYNKRSKLIGDIIIPYKIGEKNYDLFTNYLRSNFNNQIVIKKDFTCAGKGVYVIDLDNYDLAQQNKFKVAIKNNSEHYIGMYITPYYEFEEEYRFYFNKNNGKIKIYSFKKKKVLSSFHDIAKAETFQYYKNVKLIWEYVENKDWDKYKPILKIAYRYIKNLEYSTGTLEFGKTKKGEIIFFEVNSMSATVCYSGEDEINMNSYYLGIFDNLLK